MGEIELPEYEKMGKLGEGTYGVVYKQKDVRTGEIVAIKVMHIDHETEGISAITMREISILKALSHRNIVTLKTASVNSQYLYLVFEYMDCSLRRLLKMSQAPMDHALIRSYAYQMLCGIYYMHLHRVMHRDIKPDNMLIDTSGQLKICDFGLARYFTIPLRNFTDGVITMWYRPPEILLHNEFYDISVDIWSAGCVIAEMVRGTPLFTGDCELDMLHKIFQTLGTPDADALGTYRDVASGVVTFPSYQGVTWHECLGTEDDALVDLVRRMCMIDAGQRITAEEALRHPYFNDVPPGMKDVCYPRE